MFDLSWKYLLTEHYYLKFKISAVRDSIYYLLIYWPYSHYIVTNWYYVYVFMCPTANLAQIAFESVVSIVNSLHNSQELNRDQQGRNSLLASYLYWVFRLPDSPQEAQNTGTDMIYRHSIYSLCPDCCIFFDFFWGGHIFLI